MRYALLFAVVVATLTAGCISSDGSIQSPNTSDASVTTQQSPSDRSTRTAETTASTPHSVDFGAEGVRCGDGPSVSFYALGDPGFWASNSLLVGYYVPPETDLLVVAYVDGVPSGVRYEHNDYEDGVHSDGTPVELNATLSGLHTVEVVLHSDEDEDGKFDPTVDAPCHSGDSPVTTGPERLNFSRFE
jgi:hypothetical protein